LLWPASFRRHVVEEKNIWTTEMQFLLADFCWCSEQGQFRCDGLGVICLSLQRQKS
jgi:hypothetical protein